MIGRFLLFLSAMAITSVNQTVVQLSNSESKVLCKRVFSALNYPAGYDTEIADVFVWLASAEIVPLSELARRLHRLHFCRKLDSQSKLTSSASMDLVISNEDDYCSLLDAIDTLVACTVRLKQTCQLTLREPHFAVFLLPLIIARSRKAMRFDLRLPSFRALVEMGELRTSSELASANSGSDQETGFLNCVPINQKTGQSTIDQSKFVHYFDKETICTISSRRIDVDTDSYRILKEKAAESFVPNSELSRRSGAGAEVDDSI